MAFTANCWCYLTLLYFGLCYNGNVRAQEKCTITPTNPSSMTVKQSNEITAEGVLVNGTINTILQCVCKNRRGSSLRLVRWYTPIGIQLSSQSNQNRPYNRLTSNSRVGSLIIPLFGDRYKGNYTCGIGSSPSKLSPNITIDLKLVPACPQLTAPDNGDIDCSLGDDGAAGSGDTCIFTCDNGYVLSGTGGRKCKKDSTWSGTVTTCIEVPTCPSLNSPSNGIIQCSLGHDGQPNAGESCIFTCDDEYELHGSDSRTCKNDKTWSGTTTTCARIPTCPPLTTSDGMTNCSLGDDREANPGDTCTITCDDGYELGGSTSRTCGDDGSWSGTDTTCTRVLKCPPLNSLTDGMIVCSLGNDGEANPGDICTFTCDNGYELNGSASRICTNDETWSGTINSCTKVTDIMFIICSPLTDPPNGMIACSLGDNGIANPGESCAFTCDDGFQINGNIGRTCQNDGKWSGAGTTCSRAPAVITQHPESQSIDLYTRNFNITLKCRAHGYKLIYSWTRNNIPILLSGHFVVKGSDLVIVNVTPSDSDHYQCIVSSLNLTVPSKYAAVTVKVPAPRIITHPTDTSAAAPFSVVFNCSAQGYETITIEWKRKNSSLPIKANIKQTSYDISTSSLTITNITEYDAGTYYCIAWAGRKGSLSREATLFYAGSPMLPVVVISYPLVLLNVSNFNLSMKCIPDSVDHQYEWRKRYEVLPTRAQGVFSSQMTIGNLVPEDSGNYQCIISNSTGKIASDYSILTVEVSLPVFLMHPKDVKVEVYKSVAFLCEVSGFGNITIIWKRIGFKLPITSRINVSKAGDIVTSILNITRTSGFYAGQYYCVAKNSAGEVRSQIAKLSIQAPCPEMIRQPKNITVLPGETANFSCFALSHSGLIYEWTRSDNKSLPVMSQKTIWRWLFLPTFNQITAIRTLMIFNSQPSVEGWYCCTAINNCGKTKHCAWLEVNTIPIIDKHPVSTKSRQRNEQSTVMSCSATGMGPIHYKWEKYQSSSNSWIRPSHRVVNIASPKLIFSVITEEDEGIYHCVVGNDDGSVISGSATLTVYGPPTIHSISSKLTSFEGEKVNLTCSASNDIDASEPLTIFWYGPRGTQLTSDMKNVNIYYKDDSITAQNTSILLMDTVNNTDTGQYTCRAFNHPKSYSEKKTSLDVEYSPRVTIDPASEQRVNVGMRLLLYCEAYGQPVPTVQWYSNNIPAIPIAQLFQQLYSVPTDSPHTTVYTCVGRNSAGNMPRKREKSVTVTVQVMCPPLNDPKNGEVFIKQEGEKAVIICNDGFNLIGNETIDCVNGIWNSPLPTCL